jgi:hypothetical protein
MRWANRVFFPGANMSSLGLGESDATGIDRHGRLPVINTKVLPTGQPHRAPPGIAWGSQFDDSPAPDQFSGGD